MNRIPQRTVLPIFLALVLWVIPGCGSETGADPGAGDDRDTAEPTPDPGTDAPQDPGVDLSQNPDTNVLDDTGADLATDPGSKDAEDTSPCIPDCDDRDCGDDGCGSVCGTCTGPVEACQDGTCNLVGFDMVNTRVFRLWCASCHSGPTSTPPVSYPYFVDNHEETLLAAAQGATVADRILFRTVTVRTMPPGRPLSAEDQDLVDKWVKGGAGP